MSVLLEFTHWLANAMKAIRKRIQEVFDAQRPVDHHCQLLRESSKNQCIYSDLRNKSPTNITHLQTMLNNIPHKSRHQILSWLFIPDVPFKALIISYALSYFPFDSLSYPTPIHPTNLGRRVRRYIHTWETGLGATTIERDHARSIGRDRRPFARALCVPFVLCGEARASAITRLMSPRVKYTHVTRTCVPAAGYRMSRAAHGRERVAPRVRFVSSFILRPFVVSCTRDARSILAIGLAVEWSIVFAWFRRVDRLLWWS